MDEAVRQSFSRVERIDQQESPPGPSFWRMRRRNRRLTGQFAGECRQCRCVTLKYIDGEIPEEATVARRPSVPPGLPTATNC
jgi:hypothetical protein